MGWFSCYGGSRTKEKKTPRRQQQQQQQQQQLALPTADPAKTPPLKAQSGDLKTAPLVDATKVAPKNGHANTSAEDNPGLTSPAPNIRAQTFTFWDLAVATDNFRPECLIGEGGFGCVYKGRLEDDQVVAIKQLDQNGLQGNREFLVEVLMLSLLHHENLVNLIGYCADGDQRLLVYEFMPLGSLEDHLHDLPPDKEPLDWTTRMKIAAGAAKGLEYLHDIANPPVIYRDLKSSNILLGEGFFPKLSDFGLAKLGPVGDKTHVSTRVMGTYGYCAPEYAMTGQLTLKSDVYSFGVVLLELITGRRAIDQTRPSGEHNLVAWARPLFKDRRKFGQMADPKLKGHFPVRGLFQALAVAAMCLHEQAASRPSIADVVTALNFLASQTCDLELQSPSKAVSEPPVADNKDEKKGSANQPVQQMPSPELVSSAAADKVRSKVEGNDAKAAAGLEAPSNGSPAAWRAPMEGKDREQAVAEARVWGEAWREKRAVARVDKGCFENSAAPISQEG